MQNRTMLAILGILLALGAMSAAIAQNTGDDKTNDAENHECTPEMMENMPQNCPEQMMESGACENMMNGGKGCGGMMANAPKTLDAATEGADHCGDMGSGMGTMMGSSTGF